MGRALRGSRWESNGKFHGGLPRSRGDRDRVAFGFAVEDDREAWLGAGIAAIESGRPVPDPRAFDQGRAPVDADTAMPRFEDLANAWADEYYRRLRRGGAERERDVRILIDAHLIPAFAGPIPADPVVARSRLVDFVRRLAAEPEFATDALGDAVGMLTLEEAATFCHRSVPTIRRALRAKRLPGAVREEDGWHIPASDLVAAGVGDARPALRGLSRAYGTDILWVNAKILDWGRSVGWNIPPFERDIQALTPDDEVARKRRETSAPRPFSFAEVGRLAVHLHVTHQLVLWLIRVLGLRISEAYGLHVGDIIDLGDVGLAVIDRQGGRPFLTRTRAGVVVAYEKETLKREASHRVLIIPPALMAVIRVVVEAFHTDPSGDVDLDARLVPWTHKKGTGQQGFRTALDSALRLEGLDADAAGFEASSHHLRKSLATDLAWDGELDELAKRRVLGHRAGDDVFARHYTLEHPTLAPLRKVAMKVQAAIEGSMETLLIPTERRMLFVKSHPLRERRRHIETVLGEAGWQVEPGRGDPWLDAASVAAELEISVTTARRWLRNGVLPASWLGTDGPGSQPRLRARLSAVTAFKQRLAGRVLLRDLADDLGVTYHRVYAMMRRLDISPDRDDQTDEIVLAPTEADAIRGEFNRDRGLLGRSMRLGEAAAVLDVPYTTVRSLINGGQLIEDPERDVFGARFVIRESVEELRRMRGPQRAEAEATGAVSIAHAAGLTGLTVAALTALADQGLLDRRARNRHAYLTTESLVRWAAGYRPELLPVLSPLAPNSEGPALGATSAG